jgi:hypothetical protein
LFRSPTADINFLDEHSIFWLFTDSPKEEVKWRIPWGGAICVDLVESSSG